MPETMTRWDVQDNRPGTLDSGAILDVPRAFDGFALLHVQVDEGASGAVLVRELNLSFDGVDTWDALHPAVVDGVVVSRSIRIARDGSYARYLDSFTNFADEPLKLSVSFGGSITRRADAMLAFVDATPACTEASSAGGYFLAGANTDEGQPGTVSALVYGEPQLAAERFKLGNPRNAPFEQDAEPGAAGYVSVVTDMTLAPGESRSLMFFVVNQIGLAADDALQTTTCATATALLAQPDATGLTALQRQGIQNWRLPAAAQTITRPDLQQASLTDLRNWFTDGSATPEDLVAAYLERIAFYDRQGLALNALISINPDVYAKARAYAEDTPVEGAPLWGLPYIAKDNIDIAGYPTSIGVKALANSQAVEDAPVIAVLEEAGAFFLAKSNMDDFAMGGFAASSLAGKTVNMFSTLHNPSGSSGGSGVATSVGMGAFSLGTDTCRSLSNPASYLALATMRPTREAVDISGIAPLWPMQDVVGPLTRTVDDLDLVLQAMGIYEHGQDSPGVEAGPALTRLGVARQRFIGLSGETDVAAAMEPVLDKLRAAGFELVDVEIPDLDTLFEPSSSNHDGIFKRAIDEFLATRTSEPNSLEEVYATGQFIARSEAWLAREIAADYATDELLESIAAGRAELRAGIVAAMDAADVSALVFPAAHSQPDPLESRRWAPGTCKLSAQSGLPQVTVPVTLLNERWPLGLSLMGKPYAEPVLIAIARTIEDLGDVRARAPYLTR